MILGRKILKILSCVAVCCAVTLSMLPSVSAVQSGNTVRVGFFALNGYHNVHSDGTMSGYGYDYMQRLKKYTGYSFEYTGYERSWDEMLTMLSNGEIDLLTSPQRLENYEKDYIFSEYPIGSCSYTISVKNTSTKYITSDPSELNGIKIGMLSGDAIISELPDYALANGFSYTTVLYESEELMKKALDEGLEIEAIASSTLRRAEGETPVLTFNSEPFYIIARKDRGELMSNINSGLARLQLAEPQLSSELMIRYYSGTNASDVFTEQEQEYIERLRRDGTVLNGYLSADGTLAYFNENLLPCGIVAEIIEKIELFTGITIKLSPSMQEDTVLNLNLHTDSSGSGVLLTEPYLSLPCVSLMKHGTTHINKAAAVFGDRVSENQSLGAELEFYESAEECIEALRAGHVDAAFLDSVTAERAVFEDESNQLLVSVIPGLYYEYAIGVRTTADPMLVSIFDKTIRTLKNNGTINGLVFDARNDFTSPQSFNSFIYDMPVVAILGVVLIAVVIIAVTVLVFRSIVIFREKNNKMLIEELTRVISADSTVYEYDLINEKKLHYEVEQDGSYNVVKTDFSGEIFPSGFIFDEDGSLAEGYFSREALQAIVRDGRSEQIRCKVRSGSGSYKFEVITVRAIPVNKAHPCNVFVIRKGIDDQMKREQSIKEQYGSVMEQNRIVKQEKCRLIKGIANKISEPLSVVYSTAKLSDNDYSGALCDCVGAISGVADDSYYISGIEGGTISPTVTDCNLRYLFEEIDTIMEAELSRKNIIYRSTLEKAPLRIIRADEKWFEKLLCNLLRVAVRHSRYNGSITLAAEESHNKITFIVSDNGLGFTANPSEVFMPFTRLNADVSESEFTGLELFACAKITERLGGKISYNSRVGFGTVFMAEFPLEAAESQEEKKVPPVRKMKVLLADGDKATLDYEKKLLDGLEVSCECVPNGFEAINIISRAMDSGADYDAYILDDTLPEMNAMEVVRRFYRYINASAPFIVLTAGDFAAVSAEFEPYGTIVWQKPLTESSFKRLLQIARLKRENLPAEEQPVKTEEAPVQAEEAPVQAEEAPVQTEEAPVQTEEAPVQTEEASVQTEEAPVQAEEVPVQAEEAPAKAKPKSRTPRKSKKSVDKT